MLTDAHRNLQNQASGASAELTRVQTGIEGLDAVLGGGLLGGGVYVVEGPAGAGKTTLALQFLLAGRACNEPCLLVTTAETRDELTTVAQSHGWSLAGIEILELSQATTMARLDQRQTVFRPSRMELDETMQAVLAALERVQPMRLVLDSVSTLRYMADEPFVYQRHMLSLKHVLIARRCTALIIDELLTPREPHLRTLALGVIQLVREVTSFGNERRQVAIVKMRATHFRSGMHNMLIETGGIRVFPRLISEPRVTEHAGETLSTGVEQLDVMLGGGLDRGTAILLMGTTGTGKSSIAMQCAAAALQRGQSTAVYLFDEQPSTWFHRAAQLGCKLREPAAHGNLIVQQVDPAEMSPAQFAYALQQAITQGGAQFVILDSLTGYVNAMPDERFLTLHLHELLTWLGQHGVTSLLVLNQHGLFESATRLPVDLSYLSDTLILLRFFEYQGAIHRALSVVKRRSGPHESTIREMTMGPHGIALGEPLGRFRGVLSGLPIYEGDNPGGQLR